MNGNERRWAALLLLAALAAFGSAIVARALLGEIKLGEIVIRSPLNLEAFFALAVLALGWLCARNGASAISSLSTRDLAAAALVAILAIAAFVSTRRLYFLSDDFLVLRHAQVEFSLARLRSLMTTPGGDGHFNPLVYLFNMVCWRFFQGNPAGWHSVGYALHAINCVLVYLLAAMLGYSGGARFFAASLFAIHGSRPEPVVWVTAHPDLLSTLCVLAGLLCLIGGMRSARAPRTACFTLAILFMSAGILCKEEAFAFPMLALLLIATRSKAPLQEAPVAIAICSVAAAIFIYRWTLFGGIGGYVDASGRPQFLSLTALGIAKSLGLRIWSLLFFPVNWSVPVEKLLAIATGAYAAALAALSYRGIPRRRWVEGVGFIFLAALPIVSRLLIPADAEGSRILYLPSVGFCLLLASSMERAGSRLAIAAAGAILLFHAAALRHNLIPWDAASSMVQRTCREVAACGKPKAVVTGLPRKIDGVYTFANGFAECVAMQPGGVKITDRVDVDGGCVFSWDEARRELRENGSH